MEKELKVTGSCMRHYIYFFAQYRSRFERKMSGTFRIYAICHHRIVDNSHQLKRLMRVNAITVSPSIQRKEKRNVECMEITNETQSKQQVLSPGDEIFSFPNIVFLLRMLCTCDQI